MNRIVRDHYSVADIPEDLRRGLPAHANVRVTIEAEPSSEAPSLDDLFALRTPLYRSTEEIVADVRRQRDAWDG